LKENIENSSRRGISSIKRELLTGISKISKKINYVLNQLRGAVCSQTKIQVG